MRPVPEHWTVVLAGNWNLAILNPNWLAAEIFQADPISVEALIGDGVTNLRCIHENVAITPRANRVIFNATDTSDAGLARVEALACRLLELLPRTPINAIGINFGYEELNVPTEVASMFSLADGGPLADLDLVITSSEITRGLGYDDRQLNFKMTLTGATLRMHFNFHKPATAGPASIQALSTKVQAYKDFAEKILQDCYGLEREQTNVAQ